MKVYRPNQIRRCVRVTDVTNDGIIGFTTKSFTKADDEHHVHIDSQSGACECSCNDYRYRKARFSPTVNSPTEHTCKHIQRSIANLRRKGFDL